MIRVLAILITIASAPFAEARVDVKSLAKPQPLYELNRKRLYAIGTAEGSNDAITIVNGRIYVTHFETPTTGKSAKPVLKIDDSFKTRAANLIFSNVNSWHEAQLSGEARTPENLGPLMNKVLKDTGYELPGRFPFLVKGKISKLVVQGNEHKALSGIIVGFLTKSFADNPAGNPRVPTLTLNMHFVDDAGKIVGAVDNFHIDAKNNVALFLPR